ncbi:MAG: hypothetical protein ACUZ8H_05460 [Candidatus Anammoxibacter sp.]
MNKLLCTILCLFLLTYSSQVEADTAWGAADRAGTTTEMRIPLDTGAASSPGYFSLTPDIATGVFFNASGNFVNDSGFVYDSAANDLSVLNNMEAANFCDAAGANCVATTAMVTASSTDTFTNKTFDANGTGNSITNIDLTADVINDLPVTEGGTGSSTSGGARTNLGLVIGTDVQAFDADNALLDVAQEYTATQNFNATALTSTSNVTAWALASNQVVTYQAVENSVLAAPTGGVNGATYIFIFTQHASSAKTFTFNAKYHFAGGTDPTISTGASAVDVISCVFAATVMYCSFIQDIK